MYFCSSSNLAQKWEVGFKEWDCFNTQKTPIHSQCTVTVASELQRNDAVIKRMSVARLAEWVKCPLAQDGQCPELTLTLHLVGTTTPVTSALRRWSQEEEELQTTQASH